MPRYRIEARAVIDAPSPVVYAIIADYQDGHPHILPRPPFLSLEVVEGGVDAGTAIRYQMRILGKTRTIRASVTEPEPGRVLAESEAAGEFDTTFTVDPVGERATRVTIGTDMESRGGWLGRVERSILTRILRPVYERQIDQLAAVAAERAAAERH